MRSNRFRIGTLLVMAWTLVSCSGLPKAGGGGGGGGGGGTVPISLTLSAVPAGVPANISLLSFTVNLSGITLTSQTSGATVSLNLNNLEVDLNKLLSDSAYLGKFTVASDFYSQIQLSIASSTVVYCTSTSGVAGCTPGSIAKASGGATVLTFTYSPALNPTTTGIGVRFRLSMLRALILNTAATAVQSIDFTQPLVGFSEQLPLAANLPAPLLDYIDDVTGVVTAVGPSSVTIQSATAGTFTANVVSASGFSLQTCTSVGISCAKVNQVADMDMVMNADGTFTLLLFDPLDATSTDWVEGTVSLAPTSATQFSMVVTNFVPAATGSVLGANVHLGDQMTVNLAGGTTFVVDQKNLTVPSNGFSGGQDTSVMFPGQTVAVRVTNLTAASGSTPASAIVNAMWLRFSRLSGLAGTPGPNFTFTPTPPFLGITGPRQTQETINITKYDLPNSGSSLTASQAAGISTLYLGPPSTAVFEVAKVRQ